jgi:hypothetical protein
MLISGGLFGWKEEIRKFKNKSPDHLDIKISKNLILYVRIIEGIKGMKLIF